MAAGICVVVNDTPENLETIADSGFSYSGGVGAAGLRPVLERLLKDPALVMQQAQRGRERARASYSWESVADAYEQLFRELVWEPR
jgi:glycosyltransferase involved in cell wall biosynthesis